MPIHADGFAEDLPTLLAQLESTQSETGLAELSQRLYHQGVVYPASFAALPDLIRIAEKWPPPARFRLLSLILGILTGEDADSLRRPYDRSLETDIPAEWVTTSNRIDATSPTREQYTNEIATLVRLTTESLASRVWPEFDFAYLLCALLALEGDVSWLGKLDYLRFGFNELCTNCDAEIDIFITEEPAFAECEGTNGADRQTLLQPANPVELTDSPQWLYETARAYNQTNVAGWIVYLLGTGNCPRCKTRFNVSDMFGE